MKAPGWLKRLRTLDKAIANALDNAGGEHERALLISHLLFHADLGLSGEFLSGAQAGPKNDLRRAIARAERVASELSSVAGR